MDSDVQPWREHSVALGSALKLRHGGQPDVALQLIHQALIGLVSTEAPHALMYRARDAYVSWLIEAGRYEDVVTFCGSEIERTEGDMGHDEMHRHVNAALETIGGNTRMLSHHGLTCVKPSPAVGVSEPITYVCVVKDGQWRMDSYLADARRLGATNFVIVDNGSTDGTVDHLMTEDDVEIWATNGRFSRANSGAAWVDAIMHARAQQGWMVFLDDDEMLSIPGDDLRAFVTELRAHGKLAASGLHIDLYGTPSHPGLFFDRKVASDLEIYAWRRPAAEWVHSEFRRRVFGYYAVINKAPLQWWQPGLILGQGQHFSHHPAGQIAHSTCGVLHYKFVGEFGDRVRQIADREAAHGTWREQNDHYAAAADQDLFEPDRSVTFEGSAQLTELKIIKPIS